MTIKCELCPSHEEVTSSVTGVRYQHKSSSKEQKEVNATIFFHGPGNKDELKHICASCQKKVLLGIIHGENYE